MPNNFKKEAHIQRSGFHLMVVFKPEFAALNGANARGVKYYHCLIKRGRHDVEGLIRRIVDQKKYQYDKALLFSKSEDKLKRKWLYGAVECTQAEIDQYNSGRQQRQNS